MSMLKQIWKKDGVEKTNSIQKRKIFLHSKFVDNCFHVHVGWHWEEWRGEELITHWHACLCFANLHISELVNLLPPIHSNLEI